MTKTEQVYQIIKSHPGITANEIASKLGVKRSAMISNLTTNLRHSDLVRFEKENKKYRYFVLQKEEKELFDQLAFWKKYDVCHAAGVRVRRKL